MSIKFYSEIKPYYQLNNSYEGSSIQATLPIEISPHGEITEGKNISRWKSAECLYQACKFVRYPEMVEQIRQCSNTNEVRSLARANEDKQLLHWPRVRIIVMRWVLDKKFADQELRTTLLSTGNEELIYDSGIDDAFWGNGADGKGRNELGKLLMEIRKKQLIN